MDDDFTTRPDETVLATARCQELRLPLSYPAELTLTDQRLHFTPSRLNLGIGAQRWDLEISAIHSVQAPGLHRVAVITAGDLTRHLLGRGTTELLARLEALLAQRDDGSRTAQIGQLRQHGAVWRHLAAVLRELAADQASGKGIVLPAPSPSSPGRHPGGGPAPAARGSAKEGAGGRGGRVE